MLASHNFAAAFEVKAALGAVAAGASNQNGNAIDMQGFQGVAFLALFGTLTATQVTSLKIQQSADGATGWEDLEGSQTPNLADADSGKYLLTETFRPTKRYVRCVVNRGTANAVISGVVAILGRGETLPPGLGNLAHPPTILNNPPEGTA